jgi:hypothetical protein
MSEEQTLNELDPRLCKLSVDGLWSQPSQAERTTYSKDPHSTVCKANS